jgi:hypothetical protein
MEMVAAVKFGNHLLRIIFSTDCSLEVDNAIVLIGRSDPLVCRKTNLFSVAAVIQAPRARKKCSEINLKSELVCNSYVCSVSFYKFLGRG